MRAYIVDPAMRLLPVGVTGELLLAGNQVARGYLNLPKQTEAAFLPDPFHPGQRMYRTGDLARWRSDGSIEYLGRMDGGYIKLNGLRIDVAEIEATLTAVADTIAVVQLVNLSGQSHLLAFLSRRLTLAGAASVALSSDLTSCQPWLKSCMKNCKRVLPSHSIPSLWVVVDAIPQIASNKFDRKTLSRFFDSLANEPGKIEAVTRELLGTKPPRLPETPVEKDLHDVWCQILEKDQISVHDDFFNLGGNSIGLIRVLAHLKRQGVTLTITEFYEAPSIALLAKVVENTASVSDGPGGVQPRVEQSSADGLVFQVQKAPTMEKGQPSLWMLHSAEGVGHDCMPNFLVTAVSRLTLII